MQHKAQEAYESARDWAVDLRDKYWNDAKDEFNKLIERAKEAASGVKPEVDRRIKELQERATDAAKSLEKAREIGGQAFDDAKQRFEQSLDDLRRAIGGGPATQPASAPKQP
jgi:F0F1-type ATP synthase membrane subunit b/b'